MAMFVYRSNSHSRKDYGQPMARSRIYILLIRKELMLKGVRHNFKRFAETLAADLMEPQEISWQLGPQNNTLNLLWVVDTQLQQVPNGRNPNGSAEVTTADAPVALVCEGCDSASRPTSQKEFLKEVACPVNSCPNCD